MLTYGWIAAGGLIGTLARYWLNLQFTARFGEALPWETIFINITGSFVIGLIAASTEVSSRFALSPDARAFLLVGVCGGYTTFSSFSLQTLVLIQNGEIGRAMFNILLSVSAGMIAVWAGVSTPALLSRLTAV
ncbi:fluoride efflux transporter CrcB [Ancylobacter mangrovi]|uniref:fluoride efflux transporter CrcB n=1 Tax=Ancylobacter mangrovi TaxID=2972472 RepID=UPI002163F547|nr:fluoride efflux transporter CrcB [Ancylobacter mangrovi]MCS0501924.1 fluoride efflux transporter CrcB [Ancylobacter mangrovi]